MDYKAKKVYQDKDVVSSYDEKRFKSLKGIFVNKIELDLICNALNFARVTPPALILDIPCGTGRLSLHLAQKGFSVKAIDLSAEMVGYLEKKIKKFGQSDRITAEIGDAELLAYPDNSFDCCISLRLFGHTPSLGRKKILSELRRTTKKYCIAAYYQKNCLQNLLRCTGRANMQIEWHPVTYQEIKEEMKSVGLKPVKYFPLLFGISETVVVLAEKDENPVNK